MSALGRCIGRAAIRAPARSSVNPFIPNRTAIRWQTNNASTNAPQSWQHRNPALVGGLVGGSLVFLLSYGYYKFSGAGVAVSSIQETHKYFADIKAQVKKKAPEPNEAVNWLKETSYAYVGFVPGGRQFVDKAFDEIESIRHEHGEELNKIVNGAYRELNDLADKGGVDLKTAGEAWSVIYKYIERLQKLATQAGTTLLDKHPDIKTQYGQKLEQLKTVAGRQGGETKEAAEEAYNKIKESVTSGKLDSQSIGNLIQEGFDKVQKLSNEGWQKALDSAKPFLDKNPEIKKLVEENGEKLKELDFDGIVKKIQDSAKSGDADSLRKSIEHTMVQAQGMSEEAWEGAKARASIYLDKYPQLQKLIEDRKDILRKSDFEELMNRLRRVKDTGDTKPVEDYIRQKVQQLSK